MMPSPSTFGRHTTADRVLEGIDLADKVAIVTGANAGIGFETARALAAHRAQVIIACRDQARGDDAVARIRRGDPQALVEARLLDLASLDSVRRFASSLPATKIEMLICNAGVFGGGYHETAEGFERTVGVCHIGHFLLVHLLLDRLAAAGGRVVVVSSVSHRSPPQLDFSRLPLSRENYSDLAAYGQAKLCNVLFAKELERRYASRGIHAYSLHPGSLIATSIGRHSLLATLLIQLVRPFTKSLAQGAATSVYCAAHPAVSGLGGEYFVDCAVARSSRESRDPEVARRLWELSETWVGRGGDRAAKASG
jgi:WW domain-containing oxidoreductase